MSDNNKINQPNQELPRIEKMDGGGVESIENITEISTEKKEIRDHDEKISSQLRREIEMMELDESLKKDANAKAQKIEFLGEKEKIERLLEIAKDKGLIFAIQVARKMNEPYLLDILHDTLAQEGFYKDFTK